MKIVILLAFVFYGIAAQETVSVKCDAGTFIGTVRNLGENVKVDRFLGIPYAEPPIGDLRFRKPVPKAKLLQPFVAERFGNSCFGLQLEDGDTGITESEDCLFLNIFAPHDRSEGERLPVLIYIHGGGFNIGTSTLTPADSLSRYGRVIVVTLNYRLNIWGFLSTGDDISPGNYGLWDQHLAIQWVHRNIEAFGGDRDLVTIAGDSAGAASVIYQSMFPGNIGLFKRIIPMSGSITCPWAFNEQPLNVAKQAARLLGCKTYNTQEMFNCIKSKPAEEIVTAFNKDRVFVMFPMEFVTVIDGEFIKHHPKQIMNPFSEKGIQERTLFSSYDCLAGVTSGEGLMMLTSFVGIQDTEGFTVDKEKFGQEVDKISQIMFGNDVSPVVNSLVFNEYFPWSDPNNASDIREAFIDMSSDYVFYIQGVEAALLHSRNVSSRTYFYVNDAYSPRGLLKIPTWTKKLQHYHDITYLFGYDDEFLKLTMPITDERPADWEIKASRAILNLWTNFMRTGNPNEPNDTQDFTSVEWPAFTLKDQNYLKISHKMSPENSIGQYPFAKSVDFWTNVLPSVIQELKSCGQEQKYCSRP